MAIAHWMILLAAVLPYATVALAKGGSRTYDNSSPRIWTESLAGWRRRAEWAHRNHFEAFAPFAAAVLVAELGGAQPALVNALAVGFVVIRLGYTAAYLTDRASLRSALWLAGYACVVALFIAGV